MVFTSPLTSRLCSQLQELQELPTSPLRMWSSSKKHQLLLTWAHGPGVEPGSRGHEADALPLSYMHIPFDAFSLDPGILETKPIFMSIDSLTPCRQRHPKLIICKHVMCWQWCVGKHTEKSVLEMCYYMCTKICTYKCHYRI